MPARYFAASFATGSSAGGGGKTTAEASYQSA
jgi:hypothetical protein